MPITSPDTLELFVDVSTGALVRDFESTTTADPPDFTLFDYWNVNVIFVEPSGNASRPWRVVDIDPGTTHNAIVSLGVQNGQPVAGDWTITYKTVSTTAIPYNATPSQLQTILNAHPTIISEGDVTVTGDVGFYVVTWVVAGAGTGGMTVDVDSIVPVPTNFVEEVVQGATNEKTVEIIWLSRPRYGTATLSSATASAGITVTELVAGSASNNEIQRVTLSPEPYEGVFTLTFGGDTTTTLPYNAGAADIKAALEALDSIGTGRVSVTGAAPVFEVEFIGALGNANQAAISGSASGLSVPQGATGVLNVNTKNAHLAMQNSSSISAKLEIQTITISGSKVRTLYQGDTTIYQSIYPDVNNAPA